MILLVLNKISKEERESLEELYTRLKDKMFGASLNILRDTFDAQDAVSNTFILISENFHLLNNIPTNKIDNYCITMIKNESYRIYNERKKETPLENLETIYSKEDSEEEILKILDIEELNMLMKNLKIEERKFLKLKYFREWTYEELSNYFKISEQTARKRHQRILEKLRKEGEKNG